MMDTSLSHAETPTGSTDPWDALTAKYTARIAAVELFSDRYREIKEWFDDEVAHLLDQEIPTLPEPPPPICGVVPRLDPVLRQLRKQAWDALEQRDAGGFLSSANSGDGLWLVWYNARLLLTLGIYEQALLYAYTGVKINLCGWTMADLRQLLRLADRQRLLGTHSPDLARIRSTGVWLDTAPYGAFGAFRGQPHVNKPRGLPSALQNAYPTLGCTRSWCRRVPCWPTAVAYLLSAANIPTPPPSRLRGAHQLVMSP